MPKKGTYKKNLEAITLDSEKFLGTAYDSMSPIGLVNIQASPLRFYSGSGFFFKCPLWKDIFFVTAKHCVCDKDDNYRGELLVHLDPQNRMPLTTFSHSFYGTLSGNKYPEDIIVYVVDGSVTEQMDILNYRSLFIPSKIDEVHTILETLMGSNVKLRLVGSPHESREYVEKITIQSVDFPNREIEIPANTIEYRPRGLHGDLASVGNGVYLLENINRAEDLNGYSGSPVVHLEPVKDTYCPVPVGVVVMGGNGMVRFLSMTVVTSLIEKYMADPQDPDLQVRVFDKQVVPLYSCM